MTDYLEQPEEQENALLEQTKRLEQALSALPFREETGAHAEGALDWFEDRENSEEIPAWERKRQSERLLAGTAGEGETSLFQTPAQGQRKQAELPLLAQLRQLDRALDGPGEVTETGTAGHDLHSAKQAAGWSRAEPGAIRRPFNQDSFLPQNGREEFPSSGREPLQSSGDLTWAEQADRAFRRDSRRYDGGFYLY